MMAGTRRRAATRRQRKQQQDEDGEHQQVDAVVEQEEPVEDMVLNTQNRAEDGSEGESGEDGVVEEEDTNMPGAQDVADDEDDEDDEAEADDFDSGEDAADDEGDSDADDEGASDEEDDEAGYLGEDSDDVDGEDDEEYDDDDEAMEEEGGVLSSQSAKGMADVMQSILSGGPTTEVDVPILAKDKSTLRRIVEQQEEERLTLQQIKAKRAKIDVTRVKPAEYSLNHEKLLVKMATKGAVALFNAVRDHQKTLQQVDELPRKKAEEVSAMSKNDFLSMLSSRTNT